MPAFVKKRSGKYRVVHKVNGKARLVRNRKGRPVDGGGHSTKKRASAQARAVNAA